MQLEAITKIKKAFEKEWVFVLYLFVLCAMFLVRDVYSVSIPLILFIAYFAVGFFVFDYDHFLALTAIMPLLNHGVQTNYIIIVAIAVYLIRYGKGIAISMPLVVVALLMILELYHVGVSGDSLPEYLRYLVQYAFVGIILGEARIKQFIKKPIVVLKTFLFIAAYFMIDVLLVTLKYLPIEKIFLTEYRFGRLSALIGTTPSLGDNENTVAMFALVAIAITLVCLVYERRNYIVNIIALFFFSFFGLMTASKTFIICWTIMAILTLFYFGRKSKVKTTLIMLGGVVVIFVFLKIAFPDLIESVLARFSMADVTSGRAKLMELYNEFIASDVGRLLFGIGLQNVDSKTGMYNTPHNATQEVVLCWGILGFILVFALCCRIIKQYRTLDRDGRFIYILPFLAFLLFIQTIQFIRMSAVFGLLELFYCVVLTGGVKYERKRLLDNRRYRR